MPRAEQSEAGRSGWGAPARATAALAALVLGLNVLWGCAVRATADARMVTVHQVPAQLREPPGIAAVPPRSGQPPDRIPPATADSASASADSASPAADSASPAGDAPVADTIRVLAWNIAHGRGDLMQGQLQNFRGGDPVERNARLARMAEVIRQADADVVVLNEADFDAAWSGGLNQARLLALAAGYDTWVEQRNYDYSVLSADFTFGNAVLSRLRVLEARPVPIPPHSRLEATLLGAKRASRVRLETRAGPVDLVPIHLEFRSEATRLAAVPALRALAGDAPLILAGDFNTAPPGWPRGGERTAVGELLEAGLRSPRATGGPEQVRFTYPSRDPAVPIDWILVEPPLRVLEVRVLTGAAALSDHLPVLATVEVRQTGGPGH